MLESYVTNWLGVYQSGRTDLALRWPKQISKRVWQVHIEIWIRINIQGLPSYRCVSGSSRSFLPVVVLLFQCMAVIWDGRNVQFETEPKG